MFRNAALFQKTFLTVLFLPLFLFGCTGIPDNVRPVKNFESERYLGTWYEIARLDHRFERGLEAITATYTMREDGGIDVLNKGYNISENKWKEAKGKAYFVSDSNTGHLKVSFFGPFYASYVVAHLDTEGYQYAIVTGPDTDYFWILSRKPSIDAKKLDELLSIGKAMGFDTQQLIYVNHNSDQMN